MIIKQPAGQTMICNELAKTALVDVSKELQAMLFWAKVMNNSWMVIKLVAQYTDIGHIGH